MIFYISGDGGAKLVSASPVHQGSADTCRIGVIAPFADNVQVTCAFRLADGSTLAPALMTRSAKLDGIFVQATDSAVGYWEYDLPGAVSEKYGRTYVQFYFYSAEEGAVFASAETSFLVSRGVSAQLPETPDETVYGQILSAIAELSGDVFNGYYAARAIYAWNSEFTYGANEITFYPDYGEYGAFVKSVTADNKGNAPYTDGVLDSSHWEEVTDFNALQELAGKVEDIETYVQQASDSAAAAAGSAEAAEAAQTAAETAQTAAETAEDNAKNAETAAQGYADAAAESAALAEQWANAGIQVNTDYTSVGDLPRPGTSKYIYFVPVGGADEDNVYDEYIWVADKEDYELIGNTRVDLSGYAQQNGNYPQMTVGAAGYSQNVTEQIGGKALGEIFESDGTTAKEATSAGTAGKVGHKLTVTVNGQATEFDGSADQSISISTDEATDPEAVRFTPQTLTSEQQAQARANIGATAEGDYYTLYDQVVETQERFNALIASPTWLDATSVAFRGEFTATGPIVIPATVKQIDGFGLTKITVNISSDAQNAVAFGYAEMPLDDADLPKEEQPTPDSQEAGVLKKDYSVRGLYVKAVHAVTPSQLINYTLTGIANCRNLTDVTAYAEFINTSTAQSVRATGFENCNNLVNCRAGAVSYNVYNNRADGFAACNRLSNCYAQALSDSMTDTAYSYSSAFVQCRGVSNCKGQAGRCDLAEPTPTVTYTGNGRFTVYDQCRMVVNSTAETGQPADTLYYLTTEIAATTYGNYPGMTVGTSESAEKVGHKLTVTVNGQATEFDGSSDKSVTISTDAATDPEAVRFTQQTLTSEQQAQARANIGAQAAGNYYVRPTGGIPKSDLAGAVQTSLDKADSALQSAPVTSVAGKTGAVALAKGDVGLGNVDNVKQYSASNPPPYPVTSVNGQTGAVSLSAADDVEILSGLAFDPGFGQTSGNIVGYRIGKLVVITVVFTPGSSGIAWRDWALAEGIPIPANSNSDPIPQYVGTCIPETPCALSNDNINDVQFNLRAYKGSSRLWIHRCTNTNGAAVGAGVQFRGTIVYICQ